VGLRSVAKAACFAGLRYLGWPEAQSLKLNRLGGIPVLNFHRITLGKDDFWGGIRPKNFERLLEFLCRHFEIITVSDLSADSREKKRTKPAIVLSFDDGYKDFLDCALPLLRKFGVRANLNIIGKVVMKGEKLWNVELYDFLEHAPSKLIHQIALPGFAESLKSDSRLECARYGLKLSLFLRALKPDARSVMIEHYLKPLFDSIEFSQTEMLSIDELKKIQPFVEMGCHSYCHESMAPMPMDFFVEDFQKCKKLFVENLHSHK
jgi:peptidoglycan/xylan/chitin deacetylase (PgdA/CDA1 family)